MEQYKYNMAQRILIAIGGTAALVGGYKENYYADNQMAKRVKKPPTRYGDKLRAYFDGKKFKGV